MTEWSSTMTKWIIIGVLSFLIILIAGIKYGCYGHSGEGEDIPPDKIRINVE